MDDSPINEKKSLINNRIDMIDIAKGIGIILVVLGHCLPSDSYLRNIIYSFHMPLFFILSGLITKNISKENNILCAIMFQKKLLITYFIYSGIAITFDIIVKVLILNEYSITTIIWEIYQTVSLFGVNVLWFISTIVIAKIIFYFMLNYMSANVCGVVSGVSFVLVGVLGRYISMDLMSTSLLGMLIYFPLIAFIRPIGMVVFLSIGYYGRPILKIITNPLKIQNRFFMALLGFLLISVNIVLTQYNGVIDLHYVQIDNILLMFLLSFTGSISIIFISALISPKFIIGKVLSLLGRKSIFIMLVHEYLLVNRIIADILNIFSIDNFFIQIVLVLFVSTVLAILFVPFLTKCINWIINKY